MKTIGRWLCDLQGDSIPSYLSCQETFPCSSPQHCHVFPGSKPELERNSANSEPSRKGATLLFLMSPIFLGLRNSHKSQFLYLVISESCAVLSLILEHFITPGRNARTISCYSHPSHSMGTTNLHLSKDLPFLDISCK